MAVVKKMVKCAGKGVHHDMDAAPRPGGWVRPNGPKWRAAWAVMHMRCLRKGCGTWRHDAIDRNWVTIATKYDWPETYPKGDDVPAANVMRKMLFEDVLDRGVPDKPVKQVAKRPAKKAARPKPKTTAQLRRKAG